MDMIRKLYVKANEFGRGQTMAEYALILAAVAVVVFVGYQTMGTTITTLLSSVDSQTVSPVPARKAFLSASVVGVDSPPALTRWRPFLSRGPTPSCPSAQDGIRLFKMWCRA